MGDSVLLILNNYLDDKHKLGLTAADLTVKNLKSKYNTINPFIVTVLNKLPATLTLSRDIDSDPAGPQDIHHNLTHRTKKASKAIDHHSSINGITISNDSPNPPPAPNSTAFPITKDADVYNAIANVLVERTKEELTITFFNKFKIFESNHPEFKVLFPTTSKNVENLLSYNYAEMLIILKTGFVDDLKNFPLDLDDVVELPAYQGFFAKNPELAIAIHCLRMCHDVETGVYQSSGIIHQFANLKEWSDTQYLSDFFLNFYATLKFVDVLDDSFYGYDGITRVGLSAFLSKIRNDTNDFFWLNSFLGLLYQNCSPIQFKFNNNFVPLDTLIKKTAPNLIIWEAKVTEYLTLKEKEANAFKAVEAPSVSNEIKNQNIYNLIGASIDVVDYAFSIVKIFDTKFTTQDYTEIARKANSVYKDIYTKNFSQAVTDGLDVIQSVASDISDRTNVKNWDSKTFYNSGDKVLYQKNFTASTNLYRVLVDMEPSKSNSYKLLPSNIPADVNAKQWVPNSPYNLGAKVIYGNYNYEVLKVVISTTPLDSIYYQDLSKIANLATLIDNMKPYALLIANVASASSTSDMTTAIENSILPAGSSSVKKMSQNNFSVQAYLGGIVNLNQNSNYGTFGQALYITAPVGVQYSWGHDWFRSKSNTSHYSTGIFLGLLDVGAIVDYKLTNPNKDLQVNFAQVFAPSLYLVWGLPNFPLSIAGGIQAGGPGILTGNVDLRSGFMIAFDIPFFTLYNRSNKKLK